MITSLKQKKARLIFTILCGKIWVSCQNWHRKVRYDTLRLRPMLQRAMSQAVKLPKVYDLQEWRVELLLRYARLHWVRNVKIRNYEYKVSTKTT